jgi:predicted anti-sigma-YlaC factor YlaD
VNLDSAHSEVRDLLPWYVTATLDEGERRLVDEHLQTCAACRNELEWEQQLRAANNAALPARNVDRAFAAMRARLPARSHEVSWFAKLREQLLPRPWTGWALTAQAVVIVGLAVALWSGRAQPIADAHTYRALSRSAAAQPVRLVVAFAPQTPLAEIRRMLLANGARIVDGPTAADAYILTVAPERADTALQQLRAEPSVLLVQSLDAKAAH